MMSKSNGILTSLTRLLYLISALLLSACFSSKDVELQQWMVEQKGNTPARVIPIAAPKKFVPQAYTQQSAMELFVKIHLNRRQILLLFLQSWRAEKKFWKAFHLIPCPWLVL
jgi:hypothetical protein